MLGLKICQFIHFLKNLSLNKNLANYTTFIYLTQKICYIIQFSLIWVLQKNLPTHSFFIYLTKIWQALKPYTFHISHRKSAKPYIFMNLSLNKKICQTIHFSWTWVWIKRSAKPYIFHVSGSHQKRSAKPYILYILTKNLPIHKSFLYTNKNLLNHFFIYLSYILAGLKKQYM